MKSFSKISLFVMTAIFCLTFVSEYRAQISYPPASQKQTIIQSVGDGEIKMVFHRPNVKKRLVWGSESDKAMVPYGKVWRSGANNNTTFEVTQDAMINGEKLPKGKYGFHTIPNKDEWIIIFNEVNDAWGSFSYKEENDALRINVKPEKGSFKETMGFSLENVTDNSADVVIEWENIRVPFTVDVGDVAGRLLNLVRTQYVSIPFNGANFVLNSKIEASYGEAIGWVDGVLSGAKPDQADYSQIFFDGNFIKSRLLAATGKKAEAIALAEKTIAFGNAENKKAVDAGKRAMFSQNRINSLQSQVKNWKGE